MAKNVSDDHGSSTEPAKLMTKAQLDDLFKRIMKIEDEQRGAGLRSSGALNDVEAKFQFNRKAFHAIKALLRLINAKKNPKPQEAASFLRSFDHIRKTIGLDKLIGDDLFDGSTDAPRGSTKKLTAAEKKAAAKSAKADKKKNGSGKSKPGLRVVGGSVDTAPSQADLSQSPDLAISETAGSA